MKTRTVTVREGEYLGPVDWNYNFRSHFDSRSLPEKACQESVESLRRLTSGGEWQATTDGGWPRVGWGRVLRVGMYDGWPFWRPVPSVYIESCLGGSWHPFYSITGIERLSPPRNRPAENTEE